VEDILKKKLIFSDTRKKSERAKKKKGVEGRWGEGAYIYFQQPYVDVAAAIL
jgi:hypothetical protein